MGRNRRHLPRPLRQHLRRTGIAGALAASILAVGVVPAAAGPGSLDPSFGTNGIAIVSIGPGASYDAVQDLLIQPDGKIVPASAAQSQPSPSFRFLDFALTRWTRQGGLDLTFDGDGKVTTAVGAPDRRDIIWAHTLQPDGKILAAGAADMGVGAGRVSFALARYNPDGSLDPTFGVGGIVRTVMAPGDNADEALAIGLQPDGRIVVGGECNTNPPPLEPTTGFDFCLARYNPDGSLDPSFGEDGKVFTDVAAAASAETAPGSEFLAGWDIVDSLLIQPDGRIVAAGVADMGLGQGGMNWAIARYNADGTLDPTYGDDGTVIVALGEGDNRDAPSGGIELQPDGKIVAAGVAVMGSDNANRDFALARFNADGSLDTSFGTGGTVVGAVAPGNLDDLFWDMDLQPDGKIVAGGLSGGTNTFEGNDFLLARFTVDGSLDTTFGSGGTATTGIAPASGSGYDSIYGIAIDKNGKIVAAGECDMGPETGVDICLARYKAASD
jgi:uncharacterized delta-60 repeat protein